MAIIDKFRKRWDETALFALPGVEKENAGRDEKLTGDDILQMALDADPTGRGKYTDWILKAWQRNALRYEDLVGGLDSTVGSTLNDFETYKKTPALKAMLPEENWSIMKYKTPGDIFNAISHITEHVENNEASLTGSRELKRRASRKAHMSSTVKEYPSGLKVSIPHSVEASQFFGHRTRWCTAAKKNNAFTGYYHSGPLFIFETPDNDKFQLHIDFYKTEEVIQNADDENFVLDGYDAVQEEIIILLNSADNLITPAQRDKLLKFSGDISDALLMVATPEHKIANSGCDVEDALISALYNTEEEDEDAELQQEQPEQDKDEDVPTDDITSVLVLRKNEFERRKRNKAGSIQALSPNKPHIKAITDRSGYKTRIIEDGHDDMSPVFVGIVIPTVEEMQNIMWGNKLYTDFDAFNTSPPASREAYRGIVLCPPEGLSPDELETYDTETVKAIFDMARYHPQSIKFKQPVKDILTKTLTTIFMRSPNVLALTLREFEDDFYQTQFESPSSQMSLTLVLEAVRQNYASNKIMFNGVEVMQKYKENKENLKSLKNDKCQKYSFTYPAEIRAMIRDLINHSSNEISEELLESTINSGKENISFFDGARFDAFLRNAIARHSCDDEQGNPGFNTPAFIDEVHDKLSGMPNHKKIEIIFHHLLEQNASYGLPASDSYYLFDKKIINKIKPELEKIGFFDVQELFKNLTPQEVFQSTRLCESIKTKGFETYLSSEILTMVDKIYHDNSETPQLKLGKLFSLAIGIPVRPQSKAQDIYWKDEQSVFEADVKTANLAQYIPVEVFSETIEEAILSGDIQTIKEIVASDIRATAQKIWNNPETAQIFADICVEHTDDMLAKAQERNRKTAVKFSPSPSP